MLGSPTGEPPGEKQHLVPNMELPYERFVIHSIRGEFRQRPELKRCPMCGHLLVVGDVTEESHLSDYGREIVDRCSIPSQNVTSYVCEHCRWLAWRESIEDHECQAGADYIFASVLHNACAPPALPSWMVLQNLVKVGLHEASSFVGQEFRDLLDRELRRSPPAVVAHVGFQEEPSGERSDVYLLDDPDHPQRLHLFQVVTTADSERRRVAPIWLVNGIDFDANTREPRQALVTVFSEPQETRYASPMNGTPPRTITLTNATALLRRLPERSSASPDELFERCRHDSSILDVWVPLPVRLFD